MGQRKTLARYGRRGMPVHVFRETVTSSSGKVHKYTRVAYRSAPGAR